MMIIKRALGSGLDISSGDEVLEPVFRGYDF